MLDELGFVFGRQLVRGEEQVRTEHAEPFLPHAFAVAPGLARAARSVFSIPAVLSRPVVVVPSPRLRSLTARRSTSSVMPDSASDSTFSVVDCSARAPSAAPALTGRRMPTRDCGANPALALPDMAST